MKLVTAIRAAAALALAGGAAAVLLSCLMVAGLVIAHDLETGVLPTLVVKAIGIVAALVLCGLGAWTVATGGGVLLRRPWARTSILILGGMLAFFGATSLLVMLFISLPVDSRASPEAVVFVRRAVVGCYGLMGLAGTWWLILFSRPNAKLYFANGGETGAPARPLSITIVAWYLLVSAAFTALCGVLRLPTPLFGVLFTGWWALALSALYVAAQLYLGAGLLQLEGRARWGAILYFCLLALNAAAAVAAPGYYERMHAVAAEYERLLHVDFIQVPRRMPMALSVGVFAIPLWFLARRGAAFRSR
jgi:hypothetical protein